MLCFSSERFHHEVLPARRERLSVTGWFRRRRSRRRERLRSVPREKFTSELEPLPGRSATARQPGIRRKSRLSLQAVKVYEDLAGRLIASASILIESLLEDPLELEGKLGIQLPGRLRPGATQDPEAPIP